MGDHPEYIEIEVLDDDDDDGYSPARTKEHQCAICSGNIPSNLSSNDERPDTWTVWTPEIKMLICQAYNIHVDFQDEAIYICNPCTFILGSLKILYDQMHRSQSEFSALTSQLAARAEAALVNCEDQCAVNSSCNLALLAECGSDLNRKTLQYLICQSNRHSDRLRKQRISDASSSSMASGSLDHNMAANYSDYDNELQYSPQVHQLEAGTSVEVVTDEAVVDITNTEEEDGQVKIEYLEEEPLNLVVSDHADSDELVIDEDKVVLGSNDCLGQVSGFSSTTNLHGWRESRPLEAKGRKRPSRSRQDRTKTAQRLANGTISREVEKYYSKGMYVCPTCDKKFGRMYPFWDHLKIHTGKGSVCPECSKIFPRGHNLELHMRTHTGEKPFRCTVCERGFTDGSNLKVHMRRHTGERPYRCSDCNKGFSSSSRLNAHRLQHTGERPHQCQECVRGFCTKIQLDVHRKKAHTSEGLPKQTCKFCSKQYMSIYTLRSHIKKHHRASVTLG